jgi:hypothetical protein
LNKTLDKEDRNIIILIIIFLLVLSIYLIVVLLHNEEEDKKEIEVKEQYELIGDTDRFKLYSLNADTLNHININLNDNHINFNDETLYINDTYIIDHVSIISYIAFYKDNMVLFAKSNILGTDNIIVYNTTKNEFDIIKEVDNMFIIDIEAVDVTDAGINIHLTNVVNGKLYKDNKVYDVCEYKNNIDSYKNIMYYYDYDSSSFYSIEVLHSNKLDYYKKDIC